ncbi:hypothetical protein BPA01_29390 [Brevibacillus parabrevis]|uniref:Uncharacterized protein n=1 Tax=Brevibacillus parabrevis TaxID=54914 RepID=A0A4Y3PQF7_BREPA|nr:hypothetical protein BPA01_29390 [Brevibacillus parabrevis]
MIDRGDQLGNTRTWASKSRGLKQRNQKWFGVKFDTDTAWVKGNVTFFQPLDITLPL